MTTMCYIAIGVIGVFAGLVCLFMWEVAFGWGR